MTEDNLVWMTIGVDKNENKSRGSYIEDFDAILQRMENMSLKNSATEITKKKVSDKMNRGNDESNRKNERIRKSENSAERSTKTDDSPTRYSFNRIFTPLIYHSFLNNITKTAAMKSTHEKDKNNKKQNIKNEQSQKRSNNNRCVEEGIEKNEEMNVIGTYDVDRGSAAPNRFWILVGTRPLAVLEIREYSGMEVLDPQHFIDDVSFKIFNPDPANKISPNLPKFEKSAKRSVERDTFDKMKKEKMKNMFMWGNIVSDMIGNLNEKKKSYDSFMQLKRENEVLVRQRDLIMTLQSSFNLTDSSRGKEREKECKKRNSAVMNDGNTLQMHELKKLIHINNIKKDHNVANKRQIEQNKERKELCDEHITPSTSEDSSARTRTSKQEMFFTEELKLLIGEQCVRTLDFLSSLNLTVTQASSYIIISTNSN